MVGRFINPVFRAILFISIFCIWSFGAATPVEAVEFNEVEKILGTKGEVLEGALIVKFPRTDIRVTVQGERVPISLGFVSWIAWKNMGDDTLVMGDLVLLATEVNPVISVLAAVNINIAALHNHFLGERPRIMFLHFEGIGDGDKLAQGIKTALGKTATPRQAVQDLPEAPLSLDTSQIESITGHTGTNSGGVFRITVGRTGAISHGMEITSSMGMNSWAGFMGTKERSHVAGQIAMTASEMNPVIHALRSSGIQVVAVHNNMLDEQPRIFFLHFWGTGPVEALAQGVRSAFEKVQGPIR